MTGEIAQRGRAGPAVGRAPPPGDPAIREADYAVTQGQAASDHGAAAAPVRENGETVAAVALTGIPEEMKDDLDRLDENRISDVILGVRSPDSPCRIRCAVRNERRRGTGPRLSSAGAPMLAAGRT